MTLKKTIRKFTIKTESVQAMFPKENTFTVKDLGILEKHVGKEYTEQEVKEIVADLIMNPPYISGAMMIKVTVLCGRSYYHRLEFQNFDYAEQERGDTTIKQ